MKKVIVIVGPTGSGKTRLSVKLAKLFNAEIINGDSVQIYRRLNIGSAKIKESEKEGIPHHLFDIRDPNDSYSVFNFQNDVRSLIDQIDIPMIVGGTGLYIKAALYQYEFIEKGRDEAFDLSYQSYSNEELYQMLLDLDPLIQIDLNNRRRVLRALEQALSGEHRSKKNKKDELLYNPLIIYLDLDRKVLEDRLKLRLDKQIMEGFIEEVESLDKDNIRINAIGYRELNQYLDGKITLDEAKAEIISVSKKLAKKQKTFFKNQMNPVILDALSETLDKDAFDLIQSFLKEE
ncbi:MAG: tRNA (adenosine(37)-N6)-dimethylallyltransferase MiaA [Tenericutes bacterium HGW-Tenericutes-2]|jgi:tRNA dimethylallyltransferase|nr:MAG: tRNA (adenosine(37)-N6)-dimethylallyltransferase MiaA [Tenericutes bacterium HGW-Tenericutes-2]